MSNVSSIPLQSAPPETVFAPSRNPWLFFFALAVCVVPLFLVRYVPLVDLPGHLGRLHIEHVYATTPAFQRHYQLLNRPIPNTLIDMFSPLESWMRMEDIGRLFVLTSIVLFSLGCALASRTLYGMITPLAVLTVFSQYNSMLFFGYAPFQSGVGLFLITLALWMKWRGHFTALRISALGLLSVATLVLGKIRIDPELGPLAGLFLLLFLVSPYYFGGGPDEDTRIYVAAVPLVLLALCIDLPQRSGQVIFAIAFAALVFRVGYIASVWTKQDRIIADNLTLFDRIPEGATNGKAILFHVVKQP